MHSVMTKYGRPGTARNPGTGLWRHYVEGFEERVGEFSDLPRAHGSSIDHPVGRYRRRLGVGREILHGRAGSLSGVRSFPR